MRHAITVAVLLGALGSGSLACGSPDADPAADPGPDELDSEVVVSGAPPADSVSSPSPDSTEPPFSGPILIGEGPLRDYRLLLINALDVETRVLAAAGAATVELDTVPSRDSVRVDVRVRADAIRLEARDPGGLLLRSEEFDLDPERLNRWIITDAVPPDDARGTRVDSLVPPDSAGYPRSQPTTSRR